MGDFFYRVCAPVWYLHRGRDAFLEEYIHPRMLKTEYTKRLTLGNCSVYDGFFKGMKKRKELMKEVKSDIYFLLNQKIDNIQKWNDYVKIDFPEGADFNTITINAKNQSEARSRLSDVLSELNTFFNRYGLEDRVLCYDVKNEEFVM